MILKIYLQGENTQNTIIQLQNKKMLKYAAAEYYKCKNVQNN